MYAEIALIRNDKDTDKLYTYEIPESLEESIKIGSKVAVSFGKGKNLIMGFVLNIHPNLPDFKTKPVEEVFSPIYALNAKQIELCDWMRNKYICTYSQAIKTILSKEFIRGLKPAFRFMVKLSPQITGPESIAMAIRGNASKQRKVLEFLLKSNTFELSQLIKETESSKSILVKLQSKDLISISKESFEKNLDLVNTCPKAMPFPKQILCMLNNSERENCYLHYIDEAIGRNEDILVVSNEISESKKLFNLFSKKYSKFKPILYRSTLSHTSQESIHDYLNKNRTSIVFGSRNSLFLPFNNLGLIIVDHESEYGHKSDSMPKFHTSEVAEFLKNSHNARLIYSDISPSVRLYYENVKAGALLIGKDSKIGKSDKLICIDMKEELKHGNKTMFSMLLDQKLKKALKSKHGIILLLNQKGHSSTVTCRSCGYVMKCPHCGLTLTYYSEDKLLRCPHCSYKTSADSVCPNCGSLYYKFLGLGPEKVKAHIENRFPAAKLAFISSWNIKTYSALESEIDKFNKGEIDLLIATELILKTRLIKRPFLFSILNADMFLYGQDFQANENLFSLVRKIRSTFIHQENELLIQTYNPDQMAIRHSIQNNYESFYREELQYRNALKLPPFYHMASFHIFGDDEENVLEMADLYGLALKRSTSNYDIKILGPSKNNNLKYKARYKYQLTGRYTQVDISKFMGIIKYVNKKTRQAFRKSSVKLSFDIDARCL